MIGRSKKGERSYRWKEKMERGWGREERMKGEVAEKNATPLVLEKNIIVSVFTVVT